MALTSDTKLIVLTVYVSFCVTVTLLTVFIDLSHISPPDVDSTLNQFQINRTHVNAFNLGSSLGSTWIKSPCKRGVILLYVIVCTMCVIPPLHIHVVLSYM